MRVTVTPQETFAEASATKLRVSLSVVDPVLTVSAADLNPNINAVQPIVGVQHVLAAAEVAYVLLAVSPTLDDSGRYQYITDVVTTSDQIFRSLSKAFADTVTVTDVSYRSAGKMLADSVSVSDSFSKFIGYQRTFSDSVSTSNSGYLYSQGYCDITYFAEDYVGYYRTFT